jgi:transcription termination/antitermination protein NusG
VQVTFLASGERETKPVWKRGVVGHCLKKDYPGPFVAFVFIASAAGAGAPRLEKAVATLKAEEAEKWFALTVKPRHDKAVADLLEAKGYETLLPTYKKRRRYASRSKESHLPLFPGYVFCRFNLLIRLPILTTSGVTGIVGAGSSPLPVDEAEMYSLRSAIRARAQLQPCSFWVAGQKVRITDGSLEGVEGIIVRVKSNPSLVLSISLLQRSVLLEIDPDSVAPH